MPQDTRGRLLEVAEDLFHREGFHAIGLDRILADVGVTGNRGAAALIERRLAPAAPGPGRVAR